MRGSRAAARDAHSDADSGTAPAGWWELAPALLARSVVATRAGAADAPQNADALVAEAERQAGRALDAFRALLDEGDDAFTQVCSACELDEVDAGVLAVLAACEIDPESLRMATSLSPRTTMRPSVGVLLDLFGPDGVRAVAPGGSLDRAGLIELETAVSLVASSVAVPHSVTWRLLNEPVDSAELGGDINVLQCPPTSPGTAARVLVHGDDRVRRLQTAVSQALGLIFYAGAPPTDDDAWRTLTRRASLDGAGIVLELREPPTEQIRRWIDRCDHLTWALCTRDPVDIGSLPEASWLDLAAPPAEATVEEWAAVFPDAELPSRRPTAEQLRLAGSVVDSDSDPQQAIRRVASGTLLRHARRIVPQVEWDDLVLPHAQARRLHDLVDRYRHRRTVHEEWGLSLYPSPGVVALFSGPSGTGKTTTAEVIAHELGIDLFRVDLSALVSKYIGETEKNLEEIFAAAHAGDYLLLFDEADSLFGTRSKVSDARDRYANMEVSYLLQRLETYDGFVILTSNFQGNIDTAFLRRIHVTVHFPVPGAEDRRRIWARCLAQAPQDDLDLDFVADKFDLTGGSIRNAALSAAFLAAAGGSKVGMAELLRAVAEEMTKLGRRPTDDQFGRWLPLLGGSPASR